MHRLLVVSVLAATLFPSGCSTSPGQKPERGPQGTVAYLVALESSEPGARIEVNGDDVGRTPMTLKIFGDKDGTFHNFGSDTYVIKVFPLRAGQYAQTKIFRTGAWFSAEDKIPGKLFFDLGLEPVSSNQKIEVNITPR